MKDKNQRNYLDFVPIKNPDIEYQTGDNGKVTVFIEWKGFYHRIAQKFFHRPRVSDIQLDDYGSFVWLAIDDNKDVHQLSKELDARFPNMEKSLSRPVSYTHLDVYRDRLSTPLFSSTLRAVVRFMTRSSSLFLLCSCRASSLS